MNYDRGDRIECKTGIQTSPEPAWITVEAAQDEMWLIYSHHSKGESAWAKPRSFLNSQYVFLLTQVSSFDFLRRPKKFRAVMNNVEDVLKPKQLCYRDAIKLQICARFTVNQVLWWEGLGIYSTWRSWADVLDCSPPGFSVSLSAAVQSSVSAPLQPPGFPPPAVCQPHTDTFIMQTPQRHSSSNL